MTAPENCAAMFVPLWAGVGAIRSLGAIASLHRGGGGYPCTRNCILADLGATLLHVRRYSAPMLLNGAITKRQEYSGLTLPRPPSCRNVDKHAGYCPGLPAKFVSTSDSGRPLRLPAA